MNPDPDILHRIRDIVGRSYDRDHGDPPERFQSHRALTVTAIPGAYERASHAVIAISGTPTRGYAIVGLLYNYFGSRDLNSGLQLKQSDHDELIHFVAHLAGTLPHMVPADFRWSSLTGALKETAAPT